MVATNYKASYRKLYLTHTLTIKPAIQNSTAGFTQDFIYHTQVVYSV